MTAPARRKHGPQPRYISPATLRMLTDLFPGLVPAAVIEEAVRELAIQKGRLTRDGRKTPTGRRV